MKRGQTKEEQPEADELIKQVDRIRSKDELMEWGANNLLELDDYGDYTELATLIFGEF